MTARPRPCRPGDFDYYALEGFAGLSKADQIRFRAMHYKRRPEHYTVEEFLTRKTNRERTVYRQLQGHDPRVRNAWYAHRYNGGTLEFGDWLLTYRPRGERKPKADKVTKRERERFAENARITRERIEAKLRAA